MAALDQGARTHTPDSVPSYLWADAIVQVWRKRITHSLTGRSFELCPFTFLLVQQASEAISPRVYKVVYKVTKGWVELRVECYMTLACLFFQLR